MSRRYEISSYGSGCFIWVTEIVAGECIDVRLFNLRESNPVEALKAVVEYLNKEDCDD